MVKIVNMPKKTLEEVKLDQATWISLGKMAAGAFVFLALISTLIGIYRIDNDPSVCSYEVQVGGDFSKLNFLPSEGNFTGNVGQAGFTLKGETFCRDQSALFRAYERFN